MASIVIQRKLDSLRRCLERVQEKCPATVEELQHDADLQDIVVLNLSRAVQLCVDAAMHRLAEAGQPLPETMGASFDAMAQQGVISAAIAERMRKAVGFRNMAVHDYSTINWAIVHAIASEHLDDFKAFARAVANTETNLPASK